MNFLSNFEPKLGNNQSDSIDSPVTLLQPCIAGQWEELLPLCAFQGDFAALRGFANKAPPGSQGAYDGPLVRAAA